MKHILKTVLALLLCVVCLCSCNGSDEETSLDGTKVEYSGQEERSYLNEIQAYIGEPYTEVNGNVPFFGEGDITTESFEKYGELDMLNRCGVAFACIGKDLMPTEERESIGQVKPSGWQISKYDFIDGKYLYNRCHLIGFQLTGENANVQNLITGTRYMNTQGMLPFENMVADYVKDTGNHVLYRVTPVFNDKNLIASGVLMEAWSVEDSGEGICFNVFAYNVQPGVKINYLSGDNELDENYSINGESSSGEQTEYILNTNTKKFHLTSCTSVSDISEQNKSEYKGTRKDVIDMGYSPCGSCKP